MTAHAVRAVASALEAGLSVPLGPPPSPLVVDVLDIARVSGAPRARLLRVLADGIDDADAIRRDVDIAATASRHSAVVLTILPAGAAIASSLFGFETLGFLIGEPLGWVCAGIGIIASTAGWMWMTRLRHRIVPPPLETGVIVDVVAEILSVTGLSVDASDLIQDCVRRWRVEDEWHAIEQLRATARDSGISVASLLRAHARECRLRVRFDVRGAIEELPGRLLVPLGVCLFPAFVFLTVIPAIAGMARGFFHA